MSKTKNRWKLAQRSEKSWWEKQLSVLDFGYFKKFADTLLQDINGTIQLSSRSRILEIGSGPAGILTHLASDHRFALDPLEHFYGMNQRCREIRDAQVQYVSGQGEFLPYSANSFDFLIVDNILDHCEDIDAFFREMKRVLVSGGTIYLRNFTHTLWGIVLGKILEIFKIDKGHPYSFRNSDLLELFTRHDLHILKQNRRGFVNHFLTLLSSNKISHYLRALSFSQADKVTFILSNRKPAD